MEYWVFAGAMLLLILIIMGKGYVDEKQNQKKFVRKLYENYGGTIERKYQPGELEQHISMFYKKHEEPHQIDDITWNDLNMDDVYRQMNYSHSTAGDEYLYYRLRTPLQSEEELGRFENHVRFFMEHEDERVAMQLQFARLGRMGKYSLYEYLDYLNTLGERRNIRYYLSILLILFSALAMFYSVPAGICLLLFVLCRNMIQYYREQKEIEPYITSFHYISRLMDSAGEVAKRSIGEIAAEQEKLRACVRAMEGFKRNSFIVLSRGGAGSGLPTSSNPLEAIFDYVRMVFYLDLIKFNHMLRMVRSHLSEIDDMVRLMGELETAVVVGEYRTSLRGGYCVPELKPGAEGGCMLRIGQLYHPLLSEPVKNDITVSGGILLTGSNASGKSTFLRAAALCAVLAQTIHTCMADSYQGGMFRIYSSMSLKDDLESGDSYYMAEVKSIRRILREVEQAAQDGKQVLCFVDEVLRGTNTVERIAASTQILRALAGKNVICFAATHDLELTKLLEGTYANYHFEEQIEEEDIVFPYRLQKGPAVSRNAIALLKVLGYREELVENAEEMAEHFLQTGKWKV